MLNDGVFRAGRSWPTLLIASTTAVTKASESTLFPRNAKVSAKIEKKRRSRYFWANETNRVMDVLKRRQTEVAAGGALEAAPDQRQDALDELTAPSIGLQHVRETRVLLLDALQQEA